MGGMRLTSAWTVFYSLVAGMSPSSVSQAIRIPASMKWTRSGIPLKLKVLQAAASNNKPFLGICRGCQVMNVALGGTLYTHILDQLSGALEHSTENYLQLAHEVKIEVGTRIAEIFGEPILKVNSLHHQGLKDIAPSLRVAGHAPDGLVEAVELPNHPFGIAVQWHPEWLTDQESTRNLFRKFVEAAGK